MLVLIGTFLVLALIGLPIAISMLGASALYILLYGAASDLIIAQRLIASIGSFPLLAVPFFILAGNVMNAAGVTDRINRFAMSLVGWMRGGPAHVNIVASVVFSGMSGSALADAAGIGTMQIKAMTDRGYPVETAVGVTAASATLGPILPPSLPIIIFGMVTNVSVGALFIAGLMPGLLMTVLMMLMVFVLAFRKGWQRDTAFDLRSLGGSIVEILLVVAFPIAIYLLVSAGLNANIAIGSALALLLILDVIFSFSAVLALLTPVLLIGGMTLGWFTPTEAAVAAVVWSLFLGLVRYRALTLPTLTRSVMNTIETTASVLFIVGAASVFAWLLTVSQATQVLTGGLLGITENRFVFLLLVNLILLVVGAFLDTTAAITILGPILIPMAASYGIHPVQLGIVFTLNLMIGLLTPPVGMILFVMARITNMPVEQAIRAVLPWLIPLLIALAVITLIPAVTLWLPTHLGLIR
ncbi:MAG: TRAP transporter large permease [Pseudomonadota bacterium]|nr:TRAP transporter large permease [Pseudomonadota bacterium]